MNGVSIKLVASEFAQLSVTFPDAFVEMISLGMMLLHGVPAPPACPNDSVSKNENGGWMIMGTSFAWSPKWSDGHWIPDEGEWRARYHV